jgi:hypothetical protein
MGRQYPIGDAEQRQKIAECLCGLVAKLKRAFASDVEAAAAHHPNGTAGKLSVTMVPPDGPASEPPLLFHRLSTSFR